MKFNRFLIDAFGCIEDWESPKIEQDIIIIKGQNESGKSTLFKAIETLFYGFSPATAANNPYVPWGTSEADCKCFIDLNETDTIHIGRRLLSRPSGFIKDHNGSENLANRPLPMADHITRQIFKEVYALTADELNLPGRLLWEKIEDQILTGQYYSFIRPTGEVTKGLIDETKSLWRPDKRGKPSSRELEEKILSLRSDLTYALKNDENLYILEEKILAKQDEIHKLSQERISISAYMSWCEDILPIKKMEDDLHRILKDIGDVDVVQELPSDIEARLKQIESEIIECTDNIEMNRTEITKLEEIIENYSKTDINILKSGEDIDSLVRSYGQIASSIDRLENLTRQRDGTSTIIKNEGNRLIIGGWKDAYAEPIGKIDEASLRRYVSDYKDIKSRIESAKAYTHLLPQKTYGKLDPSRLIPGGIVFTLLGIIGIIPDDTFIRFAGIISLGIGVLSFFIAWAAKKDNRDKEVSRGIKHGDIDSLEDERKRVHDKLYNTILGVPFASLDETTADESLIMDVNTLKRHIDDLENINYDIEYIEDEIETYSLKAKKVAKGCMLALSGDLLANIDILNKALEESKDKRRRKAESKEKRQALETDNQKLKDRLKELEDLKNSKLLKLDMFPGNNLKERIKEFLRRKDLYLEAEQIKKQLDRDRRKLPDNCFEDKDKWYIEGDGDDHVFDYEKLESAKARLDEIDEKLNELNKTLGEYNKDLEYCKEKQSANEIKGEIDSLQEELEDVCIQRDRLTLLKNIIEAADKKLKEEHQPDILKRASNYFKIITDNKYSRISLADDNSETIYVSERDNPYPIEVSETISRGTKEQIYLSLRLAMMDHLDEEYRMPAFLDEVFINWDGMRIQNSFELLKEISRKRQIFIFTCHDWLAHSLLNNLKAQLIDMDGK
ncbi:MAG: AAA family ATPase [Clostridiales bacterium]|nr:AAA family ATPase [Clostridiales bacterium]